MISVKKSRSRVADRTRTETEKPSPSQVVQFPAPTAGWVENENIASSTQLGARVMENVFPTERGARIRGGCTKIADITASVVSMFTYTTATAQKMFAASQSSIYDISDLDPDAVLTAAVSGQAVGYYATEQIGTVGGDYLYAVNGGDDALLYDGTSWTPINGASTPSITGVDTADLNYVWKHKNRLWFIEKDTNTAWYLPVDSVGGAAADFSLAGVFQGGGTLLFGATWSSDAGDGMDDRIIFCSTEGEVAVYQGTNPGSAADWALVGVFRTTAPLGPKCHVRAGGDVLMGTRDGLMPMSAVVSKDPASIELAAVTSRIKDAWRGAVRYWNTNTPWEIHKWDQGNMLFTAMPNANDQCFVANANSGAWAKYTGWDTQCATIFKNRLFFGAANGFVYEGEDGGSDNGSIYISRISIASTNLGAPSAHKSIQAARATFLSEVPFNPQLSVSVDFNVAFPPAPAAAPSKTSDEARWDGGGWDSVFWDDVSDENNPVRGATTTSWVSVGAQGFSIAPQFQVTNGGIRKPDAELASIDLLFDVGGIVV